MAALPLPPGLRLRLREGIPQDPTRELLREPPQPPAQPLPPFTFAPRRLRLGPQHPLLEDGDVHRHLYLQGVLTSLEEVAERPKVSEFSCHISGCCQVFDTLEGYEHHYNTLHRNVCSFCKRSFPSGNLLDIHILEWHDSLFQIMAEKQNMYKCLVEGCPEKFKSSKDRKDHLVTVHLYPADFRFDRPKKVKRRAEGTGVVEADARLEKQREGSQLSQGHAGTRQLRQQRGHLGVSLSSRNWHHPGTRGTGGHEAGQSAQPGVVRGSHGGPEALQHHRPAGHCPPPAGTQQHPGSEQLRAEGPAHGPGFGQGNHLGCGCAGGARALRRGDTRMMPGRWMSVSHPGC
ncbi:zinc finger protein 511 [Corapipo altera]|uniref:zinc finger protein 511 n=1 Tax=Corapipo altera TaxID=415028 RepID=UPI000FD69D55|nr:zinc finger protein 511 [Corapipo altera]